MTAAAEQTAYPALMIYGCAAGFSWSEIADLNGYDLMGYWSPGEFDCALIGECMYEDTVSRPTDFAAAWMGL